MPVEQVLTGSSRYSPSAENMPIDGASSLASANFSPRKTHRKTIFCHPVGRPGTGTFHNVDQTSPNAETMMPVESVSQS